MKIICVIPARYASTRLPGKPLADIAGKPMIVRVYERVLNATKPAEVIAAVDDERVYEAVVKAGGKAIMTAKNHPTGTDRLAEVAQKCPDADVIINVQGDEPLIDPQIIDDLAQEFLNDENLCDLYKALGPDALCDTCRMYPRHTEEYEGLRELSLSLSCPKAAKIILSCKEPVRFLEEETEEEDDFEEFDFMMFSQLEDTRDVLFAVLQDRSLPLTLRISVSEQLTESYQNCIEEGRQFDIDDLLRECERHQKEGSLSEFISKHLSEKGADAASLHQWNRQKKELQVLRGLERLRPEWNQILDGAEKWLYQENEETYKNICKEFHQMYGALSNYKEEWENVGEQLMMFFVYTYFCGAVYDDMVCSKMEMALFSIRWVQEFLIVRWLENGKTLSMKDVEEISWRYAREVEHSDNNLNTLEDWLFENYYLIH